MVPKQHDQINREIWQMVIHVLICLLNVHFCMIRYDKQKQHIIIKRTRQKRL